MPVYSAYKELYLGPAPGYQYQCSKVNVISLAKIQPSALRAKEVRLYLHWYGTCTAHCVSIVCVLQNAQ